MNAQHQTGPHSADANQAALQAALQRIAERARVSTDASGAAISLGDRNGMVCTASTGTAPDVGAPLRPDAGLSGYCLRRGDIVLCADAQSDPRVDASAAQRLELRSMVVMPVFAFGRLAGMLQVLSPRPHAFGNTEVMSLAQFAQALTATLERRQGLPPFEVAPQTTSLGEQSRPSSREIRGATSESPASPSPEVKAEPSEARALPSPDQTGPAVHGTAEDLGSGVAHSSPITEPRLTEARAGGESSIGLRTLLYAASAGVLIILLLAAVQFVMRQRAAFSTPAVKTGVATPAAGTAAPVAASAGLEARTADAATSVGDTTAGRPKSAATLEVNGRMASTARAPAPEPTAKGSASRPANAGAIQSLQGLVEKTKQMKVGDVASLEKRAASGDAEAQVVLGLAYTQGGLLKKDLAKAIGQYRKAAERAYAPAEEALGIAYLVGSGVAKSGAQAVRWYTRAAEHGSVMAANELGVMYSSGEIVPKNFGEAVKWYRMAAERGDPTAQYNLARMYHTGQGVALNPILEFQWLRRAADQGFAAAQYNLALMYQDGIAVRGDPVTAVRLLREAAAQGYALAQTNLGYVYLKGLGVPIDHVQSLKWYRMAAQQGEPVAAYALSVRYFSGGDGVAQDYAEAARWTRLAAEKGHPDAQYNLGLMYERGIAITPDAVEAARWYRRAADEGVGSAQFRLGLLYASGKGVSRDVVAAYKWLTLSEDPASSAEMRALQKEMTPTQISNAQHSAEQWRSAHQRP